MDLMFAFWGNLKILLTLLAVASFIALLVSGALWLGARNEGNDDNAELGIRWFRRMLVVFPVLAVVACIPDIDELWKARIAVIKYELAAPENVKAATDTIERIGHKLECKYLGGCEEKAPEKK